MLNAQLNAWWIVEELWENTPSTVSDNITRSPEDEAFWRLLKRAQRERPSLVQFCVKLERWLIEHERMLNTNARLDYIGKRIGIRDRYGVKIILDEASLYSDE